MKKGKLRLADLECGPICRHKGPSSSAFSALPAQRIWPANETMSYDRASATCVCVICVMKELVGARHLTQGCLQVRLWTLEIEASTFRLSVEHP